MKHKSVILILVIFSFTSCIKNEKQTEIIDKIITESKVEKIETLKQKETEFQKINYDQKINVFENVSKNLKPNKKYDYWAFIEARDFGESRKDIEILYEKGNLENRKLIDLNYSREGFFVAGHHSTYSFYILATEKSKIHEIRDVESLISFLDKIDTKDEALLIASLNGFSIDNCYEEGGSYRKIKDKYELLLFKTSVFKERRQYFVTVQNSSKWDSIPKKIYCQRFEKCDCN
jgi:hypothetical protein